MNLWIDGEMFFPESWFEAEQASARQKVGFPAGREFKTKPELAGDLIERIKMNGVVFEIEYYGDVPVAMVVYLDQPQIVYPLTQWGKPSKNYQIMTRQRHEVRDLLHHPVVEWAEMTLRPNERGHLHARFGRCRVWTVFQASAARRGYSFARTKSN